MKKVFIEKVAKCGEAIGEGAINLVRKPVIRVKEIKAEKEEKRNRGAIWAARDAIIKLGKTKAIDVDTYLYVLKMFDSQVTEKIVSKS